MQQKKFSVVRFVVTVCSFIFILTGCGDSEEDRSIISSVDSDDTVEMTISGSVGDGPIIDGTIVVRGVSGTILAEQTSDEFAHYQLFFGAPRNEFPLIATVEDGIDLVTGAVPDFPMMAGIPTPSEGQVANLNPMGTLAVMLAQRMNGGLSTGNLAAANQIVGVALNFGLDTNQFPDFVSTDVNDANIANVVRASEAFGEAIRRTRDALITTGYVPRAEQILDALSADLIDGVLDGRGAVGANPRITVVHNVVSAQVALETMANRLKVGGVPATNAIDLAIGQVTAGRPTVALTDSLVVSEKLVTQARVLLDAAIRVDAGPELRELRGAVDLVVPGQFSRELPALLRNGTSDALDATSQQVSIASLEDITVLNDAVREGFDGDTGASNQAPTINGNPVTEMFVGSPYAFTPTAADADGDTLSFMIVGKPSWASFNSATGRLSGTPVSGDEGSYIDIRISVSDGTVSASLAVFDIAVNGLSNRAPSIGGTPATAVTVGTRYEFTPTASDPDDDQLSFSITGKPAWAIFDRLTGRLWGTPDAGELGGYSGIRISVSDGSASASLSAFAITVNGLPNRAPTISGSAATQVTVGSAYSFTPIASDPDGDALSFSISGKPSWASFNSNTGRLSGTPGDGHIGSYSGISISASDGSASAALSAFTIRVNSLPNRAPTISGSAATQVTAGSSYSFTPSASDPDDDALTFSISGRPSWASFNQSTGRLSGTPGEGDVRSYSGIRISVSDGSASASLSSFTITVNGLPNRAPTISGSAATQVNANSPYSFTPSASDPDGDTLTFSISGKPSWASFNQSSGRLSGTPGAGDAGVYSGIRISVSDGSASASLSAFSLTVNGLPNRAPSISGSPASEVMVDSTYSFTPTASDPDDDSLTFSISSKPSWASFNQNTGRLTGTPDAGDVGTYTSIRISVSDGTDSVSLSNFNIEVVAQALGSATLFWDAPTLNEDGTILTDLAGFKIYYGTAEDTMATVETINNSSVTTFLVENLHAGTWYFTVTAFDTTGNESNESELGSKLVQP